MATLGGTAAPSPSCGARSGARFVGVGGRRIERQLSGSVAASSGKGMVVGCSPRAGSRRCARAVRRARPCDRDVKLRAASGDGVRDGDAEMGGEAPEREATQSGRGSPGARGRKNGAGGSSPSSALVASNSLASSSRVVEFVAAWDALSPRLAAAAASGTSFSARTPLGETVPVSAAGNREMLLSALKLAIPRLQMIPDNQTSPGERPVHERAVEVTLALVDIGMDAECMSAGLLREALVAGTVSLDEIESHLGAGVMRLAHDCARLHALPRRVGSYDDGAAEKLRTFCLTFHDVRAVVVELAYRADQLRRAESLPPVRRTALALETMQLYAPMAHVLDAGPLCAELEDLSLKWLFPSSYKSLEQWLRGEGPADRSALDRAREWLTEALCADPGLMTLVGGPAGVAVKARRKSLFSTMRKVLRDGRAREDVHDLLGMRVIITPQPGAPSHSRAGETNEEDVAAAERSAMAACYRAQQIAHGVFDVVAGRTKDYLQRPKSNGYRSLHSTLTLPEDWTNADGNVNNAGGGSKVEDEPGVDANGKIKEKSGEEKSGKEGRRVELQVRTAAMHAAAEMGSAAHTAYKGGFKEDPGAADALAELVNAANAAAEERFGSFTEAGLADAAGSDADRMFRMFDLNGDGVVTREELRSVIGDLWQGTAGDGEESELRHSADELIELLDVDEDGTVSREEFAKFRTSVAVLGSLPDADAATAAAIECTFTPRVEAEILEDEDDVDVDEDDDDISAAEISKINFEDDTVAGQASWTTASGAYAPAVDVPIVSMEKARSTAAKVEEEADEDSSFSEDEIEDAVAAFAAAQAMSPPPLPPAPPAGRIRPVDETLREASRQLKDKQGGEVQWQLVWDLMRAGRPETARELFYQRTTKNPSSTTLWEQWARFELLQGDVERARGLYRAALLHAEGRPRARAESLRKWGVMEFGAGEPANAVGLFERALNVLQDAEEAAAAAEEAETVEHLGTGSASNSLDASSDWSDGIGETGADACSDLECVPRLETSESSASLRKAQAVVLCAWAQVASRSGDVTAAHALLEDARTRDGDNVRVLCASAQLAEARGDLEEAREIFAAAAERDPRDPHVALSRARLQCWKLGDPDGAREIFTAAAAANPTNYRVLQAWAVMESRRPRNRGGENLLAGVAAARPLFQRAADVAPWATKVWAAWAQAEFDATGDVDRARELYTRGLASDPTSVVCLRGLGRVERAAERFSQARDYLERALDLDPRNHMCVRELAMIEEESGNKARAARYFNVAKALVREEKAARAREGGPPRPKSGKGTWAPAEAAAAARGYAAMVKSQSASYTVRYPGGGEAGGGSHSFRSVLAAARGEAAAARRDKGRAGGAAARRGRAAYVRSERIRGAAREADGASTAPADGERVWSGRVAGRAPLRVRSRGGDGPSPVGSSLDKGPGSSLDPLGSSLDASGSFDMGASRDDAYASYMSDDVEDSFEDDSYDEQVAKSMLRGYTD